MVLADLADVRYSAGPTLPAAMTSPPTRQLWRFILPLALLASCRPPDRVEVVASRAQFRDEPQPPVGLSDQQRFAENEVQSLLTWKTPEGWRLLPATEFRHINFSFGPRGEGECYLSLISGPEARMLENFNRWRKQMALPPMAETEMESLPKKTVLLRPAPTIDVTGTYSAGTGPMMQAGPPRADWRMVGTIFEAPQALFTIKLTGPKDLVEQNLKAYDAFLGSVAPGIRPPAPQTP
jgi:hypothetical protein